MLVELKNIAGIWILEGILQTGWWKIGLIFEIFWLEWFSTTRRQESVDAGKWYSQWSLSPKLITKGAVFNLLQIYYLQANSAKQVKVFLWIFLFERLNKCSRIKKILYSTSLPNLVCFVQEECGDLDTFFLFLPFAAGCWENFFRIFKLDWCFPKQDLNALRQLLCGTPFKGQVKALWSNGVVVLLWRLWWTKEAFMVRNLAGRPFGNLLKFLLLLGQLLLVCFVIIV